jgi:hypothetical protein
MPDTAQQERVDTAESEAGPNAATQAAARLEVCRRAIGANDDERRADAADLLAMLGLIDTPSPPPRGAVHRVEHYAVGTERARAHIAWLHKVKGMLLREIAEDAELDIHTLTAIRRNETVRPETADRVLAVVPRAGEPPIRTCAQCGTKWATRLAVTRCKPCRLGRVPVIRSREHVQRLRAAKMTTRAIAALAQISKGALSDLSNPGRAHASKHISADTEARILAIPIPAAESP